MDYYNNNNQNQQFNQSDVNFAVNQALAADKKRRKKKGATIALVIVGILLVITVAGILGASSEDTGSADTPTIENQVTADNKTESKNTSGEIGNYVCTIKSAEVCKDWTGEDAIKITYSFTNNASDAQSFDIALTDYAYQDGIGLESTFLGNDEDNLLDVSIKPGVTKDVVKTYKLRDKSTKVDIEIKEFISWSNDVLTYSVKL